MYYLRASHPNSIIIIEKKKKSKKIHIRLTKPREENSLIFKSYFYSFRTHTLLTTDIFLTLRYFQSYIYIYIYIYIVIIFNSFERLCSCKFSFCNRAGTAFFTVLHFSYIFFKFLESLLHHLKFLKNLTSQYRSNKFHLPLIKTYQAIFHALKKKETILETLYSYG